MPRVSTLGHRWDGIRESVCARKGRRKKLSPMAARGSRGDSGKDKEGERKKKTRRKRRVPAGRMEFGRARYVGS